MCAAKELKMLGIKIDPEYVKKLKQDYEHRKIIRERKKRKKQEIEEIDEFPESDWYFYYIAGYTSNGVPFGISWEEYYADQFYYIAGYSNGKPYGITWEDIEKTIPKEEYLEVYQKFMTEKTPFDT